MSPDPLTTPGLASGGNRRWLRRLASVLRCWVIVAVAFGATAPARETAAAPATPAPASPPLSIFLLIGQSNMVGRGRIEAEDKVPHPRVFSLSPEHEWVPAVDPLHPRGGAGLGLSFARVLAEADPQATIGLVPCAKGSTQLDLWLPGSALYNNAVARTRAALQRGKLAGILWHQGEGDSARNLEATYTQRFVTMIEQLRRDLDAPNAPVIVGEVGHFWRASTLMNQVLRELPAHLSRSACALADGLTDKGDHIHFDTPSLRTFGRRYAEQYLRLQPKLQPATP